VLVFTVNTTDDTSDVNIGDGQALDANNQTSLRAAIDEGNAQAALYRTVGWDPG